MRYDSRCTNHPEAQVLLNLQGNTDMWQHQLTFCLSTMRVLHRILITCTGQDFHAGLHPTTVAPERAEGHVCTSARL